MGKQYKKLEQRDIEFIKAQKLFYIASSSGKEVNLSPKGYDTLRVLDESTLLYTGLPGSGNRTYRDAANDGEFTLVFHAFEGAPLILRLFCKAEIIEEGDECFQTYLNLYTLHQGIVRNLFLFHIYAVESSCGMSVPYMEYRGDRNALKEWVLEMDRRDALEEYKQKHFTPPDLSKLG